MQNQVISLPHVFIARSCSTWHLISVTFVMYHKAQVVATACLHSILGDSATGYYWAHGHVWWLFMSQNSSQEVVETRGRGGMHWTPVPSQCVGCSTSKELRTQCKAEVCGKPLDRLRYNAQLPLLDTIHYSNCSKDSPEFTCTYTLNRMTTTWTSPLLAYFYSCWTCTNYNKMDTDWCRAQGEQSVC